MKLGITTFQKLYQFLGNIFWYSMAVLITCIFFSRIFWFNPSGLTPTNVFVFESLPKMISVFLSYKSVFIFGNIIVVILIGESKFFGPNNPTNSDVYYNEYISRKRSFQSPSSSTSSEVMQKRFEYLVERSSGVGEHTEEKKWCEEKKKEKQDLGREDEDLNKRAEDFIKRVNRQRRLEA